MRSLRYLIVLTAALGMLAITNVQAQQRMVLWEEFTQWNCPPCGQANPGIEKMLGENWKNVIHIWYHGNFPDVNDDPMYLFNSSDHQGRYNYYSINSEPQCAIDGQQYQQNAQDYLGDPQDTNYDKTLLANAEGASTPVSIAITETPDGSGGAGVHIVVSSTQALSGNYMLRVAVVKAVVDTPNVGTPYRNPEVQFLNVMQKMLPDYNGSSVSIATAGGQQTFDFTYSGTDIMPTNNPSHVFVVAWVQNDANKHILNTSSDYISTTMAAAPSFMVADPGQTNSFNPSVTNSGSTPIKVISSLTTSAPNAWQVNYNVNSGTTAYTGADTTTVAAGQTASYKVNFAMTGGKGIGHAALALQEVNGDTVINSINDFYSASSDVNTAIVDETAGNTTRASVYQSALSSISNSSHISGTVPSTAAPALIGQDTSIKTLIYVVGSGEPTDNEFNALTNYVQGGGNLLITGETIYSQSDATGQAFLSNQLHTAGVATPLGDYEVSSFFGFTGVPGDSVSNNISSANVVTSNGSNRSQNTMWYVPDAITPRDNQATAIFKYTNTDTVCGVRVEPTFYNFKAVYLAFGLEAMSNTSARNQLMKNIIAWFDGTSSPNAVNEPLGTPATDFQLVQNYPNPFDGTTEIQFTLPQDEHVTLGIYDMKGALVATAANGMFRTGSNSVTFDGSNLATGVYEYRLTTPNGTLTHLMSLVKQ